MKTLKEEAEEIRKEKERDARLIKIANRLEDIIQLEAEIKILEDENTPLKERDW